MFNMKARVVKKQRETKHMLRAVIACVVALIFDPLELSFLHCYECLTSLDSFSASQVFFELALGPSRRDLGAT